MALLKAILSEGVLSFIALMVLIALAAVVGWYLGWDPRTQIAPVVIVLCVLWVLLFIAQRVIAIRRAMRIEAMLKVQNQDIAKAVGEQPGAGLLEERFTHALTTVKASPHGKAALATMPWYPVIGPPQAGKTTVMLNSTLTFPRIGLEAGNGSPHTGHCDWWFSEQAVFFDTAGRYTSRPEDREEWLRFLALVASVRRERPINGIVIVVNVAELLQLDEDAICGYA
ncbi:MAG: type VI secretion protein IcmF/TssM N-terminal domain-containing protein, partial [Myxococcota bacterium]